MVPPTSTMCAENGTGAIARPTYQYSPDQRPVRSLSRENWADFVVKTMACRTACVPYPGRTNAGPGIIQGQAHSSNSHENSDCGQRRAGTRPGVAAETELQGVRYRLRPRK